MEVTKTNVPAREAQQAQEPKPIGGGKVAATKRRAKALMQSGKGIGGWIKSGLGWTVDTVVDTAKETYQRYKGSGTAVVKDVEKGNYGDAATELAVGAANAAFDVVVPGSLVIRKAAKEYLGKKT